MSYVGRMHTDRAANHGAVIESPTDLTADWLTATIGAGTVSGFTTQRIGTGQTGLPQFVGIFGRARQRLCW